MNDSRFNYEHFFEISPDLLCIAGFDGYFKKINQSVVRTLEYSYEELYARPINDFVYNEDQNFTQQVRTELTKSKPLFNFENRYVTKSGEIVWLHWTSYPVKSEQLVFAIAKNITHIKQQEADRQKLLTKLTGTNNDLKKLTYTTSHDLRSPVNNLLALLGLIDFSRIQDKKTLELMGILKMSGDYLKETLDNYVDALSAKHQMLAVIEEVNLRKNLDKTMKSIHSLIDISGTWIHADFSAVKTIRFNKAYMESVFLNLISNSIKYARPDRQPVIHIQSQEVGDWHQLTYSDNGIGFDMEKVNGKIFGLHQKFHDHKDSKGIGLYLVHNHITSLGGNIKVDSRIDEGTTFTMTFKI